MHGLNAVHNIFVTRFGFNRKLCRSPIFPKPPPCAPDRRLPHSYVGAATRESPLIYGYLYSVCASCHIVTSKQQHRFSGRIGGGGGPNRSRGRTTGRVERDRFVTDCCCLNLTVSESQIREIVSLRSMRYSFFIPFKGADNKFVRTNVKLYGHAFIKIYNYDVDLRHFWEFAAGLEGRGGGTAGDNGKLLYSAK
jgi:hypothetical protein